jgi:hypothetical protein
MFMRKILLLLIILILSYFRLPAIVHAYEPVSVPNNHFGMHIIDTNDLTDVAKLVNSNGGDWGYVTLVIQNGERNPKRWQDIFDEMRRLHLIPIVRIASAPIPGNNNVWSKPSVDEIDGWVSFLNSLNWVIKNRYVVIDNEPNHGSEWGGIVDPEGYADYLAMFSQKLKNSNEDFFIMPAGFDASARNLPNIKNGTMDEGLYLEKMVEHNPDVFKFIDGWSSHSYPNPDFSGPGDATGRGTVATYDWELNYLKFLGVSKNLPVFITETGWTHDPDNLTTNIGVKIETAFKNAWSDNRVVAVTPFIYKYNAAPFDTFSFVNKDGQYYDFYHNIFNLAKIEGKPIQDSRGDVITGIYPKIGRTNSIYHDVLFVKNIGQSIWRVSDLMITDDKHMELNIESMFPDSVEPGQIAVLLVNGKFPAKPGNYSDGLIIINEAGNVVAQFSIQANLIPSVPNMSEIIDYLKITIARHMGVNLNK